MACIHWAHSLTTRGLRHMQVRENAVRENKHIEVEHVSGDVNPADIFSKEDKNNSHYINIRNNINPLPFATANISENDQQHSLSNSLPTATT